MMFYHLLGWLALVAAVGYGMVVQPGTALALLCAGLALLR
jgi:hypothetical protein